MTTVKEQNKWLVEFERLIALSDKAGDPIDIGSEHGIRFMAEVVIWFRANAESLQREPATEAVLEPEPGMVKRMGDLERALELYCPNHPLLSASDLDIDPAAPQKADKPSGQSGEGYAFTVDLKSFIAPQKRMSIAELKAIYGRGGTEFWFVKDPSNRVDGRRVFHDQEIVDLGITSEFYVDIPAKM